MPEPIKMADLGTKYKYFEYRDLPARKLSPNALPEVYRYGEGWLPVESSWDIMHNYIPCDEERIKEMIGRIHG